MKITSILPMLSCIILLSSCKKALEVDIELSQTSVVAGEGFRAKCQAYEKATYDWYIDGVFYASGYNEISPGIDQPGEHTIKVVVQRKRWAGESEAKVQITPRGTISFWQDASSYVDITDITLYSMSDVMYGIDPIIGPSALSPNCGDPGTVGLSLVPGDYYYFASDEPATTRLWSDTVTVAAGSCVSIHLN